MGANTETKFDPVERPEHYVKDGVECIDYIESMLTPEEFRGYLRGNVAKYLWRYTMKGKPLEDLNKAVWYLKRLREKAELKKATADVCTGASKGQPSPGLGWKAVIEEYGRIPGGEPTITSDCLTDEYTVHIAFNDERQYDAAMKWAENHDHDKMTAYVFLCRLYNHIGYSIPDQLDDELYKRLHGSENHWFYGNKSKNTMVVKTGTEALKQCFCDKKENPTCELKEPGQDPGEPDITIRRYSRSDTFEIVIKFRDAFQYHDALKWAVEYCEECDGDPKMTISAFLVCLYKQIGFEVPETIEAELHRSLRGCKNYWYYGYKPRKTMVIMVRS